MKNNTKVRPSIHFYITNNGKIEEIQAILDGLEEEEVPVKVEERQFSSSIEASYEAAQKSTLNVGLGYQNGAVALHYKNLPEDKPYQMIKDIRDYPYSVLKNFGGNAARLVKGIPLKEVSLEVNV